MADILCPNCKKNNPDFLDVCQFCQTPLKPEAMVHPGEKPTKKNTGELEPILPEWLRDIRQQSKESDDEEAAKTAFQSKVQKNEPPDLLAGLASQGGRSDDDEVPDWLAGLNPTAKSQSSVPPPSTEPETDFFAQFNKSKSEPASAPVEEPAEMNAPSQQPSAEKDELSDWFSQASAEPSEAITFERDNSQIEMGWMDNFDSPSSPIQERAERPKEEEDLSWLRELEATAKQTGDLSSPKQDTPAASREDLSWLNNLGGTSEPLPSTPKEDLSWLNNLGGTEPAPPAQPATPQEDLSWLNKLGGTPEPTSAASTQSSVPQEDLSWLNDRSGTTEPPSGEVLETASESQDQPDWLKSMAAQTEDTTSPDMDAISPRHTAPLGGEAEPAMPDWLKTATEEPSMPLGMEALDQFRETYQVPATRQPLEDDFEWMKPSQEAQPEDEPLPSASSPATIDSSLFAPANDSSLANQDVDSLLSMDMPDWLSRPEPSGEEASTQETAIPIPPSAGDDTLSPVELPSWVQAMRPVEAVAETAPSVDDQPTEREGPLAGLRGLIPIAPIGSARRPKPVSLKLQATDEQQASAALFEQILAGETNPRAIVAPSVVMSQNVLRWALSGLLLLALGSMILLRTQSMPVSPALPIEVGAASSTVANIPESSHVLVVIDYEPSLAGEMEAISGPLLDQMALLRHPRLSFLSMSPNGSALAERLMTNTNINQPSPNGLGYNIGEHYFNLGYLPGGAAGVLEFVEAPQVAMPSSGVTRLSDYSAIVVLTDHAESGRVWVEQLQSLRQTDPLFPTMTNQPLLMVSSAQAAPLLQPYVSSGQITGMINGLSDAARYEFVNNSRPGIARAYWDTFGVGLMLAVVAITLGSLWSLFTGLRTQRSEAEQG